MVDDACFAPKEQSLANFGLIRLADSNGANLLEVTAAAEVFEHVALLVVSDPVRHALHLGHGFFLEVDHRSTAASFVADVCDGALDLRGSGSCLVLMVVQICVVAEVLDGENLLVVERLLSRL